MKNKDKFKKLVTEQHTGIAAKNKARIKNRNRLRASQDIALKVLDKLDNLGWKQKELAKQMEVSAQQITKIVSGKENLTLETIVKLEKALGISILASSFQNSLKEDLSKYIQEYQTSFFSSSQSFKTLKTFYVDKFEKETITTEILHEEENLYATAG